jgi:hypothetical protein
MRRAPLTFITLSILILVRSLDLVITFHFSPSLSAEGNPVFLMLGGGTPSLLLTTSFFSFLAVGFLHVFWRGRSLPWRKPPSTLGHFVHRWLQRVAFERQPFTAYFCGNTHACEGIQAVRLFGMALSWALIFGSGAALYAWGAIFMFGGSIFLPFFSFLSIGRFSLLPSIFAVFGFFLGALLFFLSDFVALRHQQNVEAH